MFTSPEFSAPEMVYDFKNVTLEADIYSLGCILWRQNNPGVKRIAYRQAIMQGPIGVVTARATEDDPAARYSSVREFQDALFRAHEELATFVDVEFSGDIAESIDKLSNGQATAEVWAKILEQLPNMTGEERHATFTLMNSDLLLNLQGENRLVFSRAVRAIAEWARDGSFAYEFCDVIAGRLANIYGQLTSADKILTCLALLSLATRHNRWYVMRLVRRLVADSEEGVIARLAMEIRRDSKIASQCRQTSYALNSSSAPAWPEAIDSALAEAARARRS